MSARTLLTSMFRYKAWADEGLFAGLLAARGRLPEDDLEAAWATLDHAHAVDGIFRAHLEGRPHAYTGTHSPQRLAPGHLLQAVRDNDRWFVAHVQAIGDDDLAAPLAFDFTDGSAGRMSREEMLGHVIAHGGYHRGEVGQILTRHTGSSPRDTFTAYLHEAEPARRLRT
jgi:uncharacterized damage-inducible protein DinB